MGLPRPPQQGRPAAVHQGGKAEAAARPAQRDVGVEEERGDTADLG